MRTVLRGLMLPAIALLGGSACSGGTFEPTIDCRILVGQYFIQLDPVPLGYSVLYEVFAGDSIQLGASLRRVDAAQPAFNPQVGWSCATSASSPVAAAVSFSTTDTDIVRLSPGGWIHGLRFGDATVTASSTQPPETMEIAIFVYGP